jgi:hypothetical protein
LFSSPSISRNFVNSPSVSIHMCYDYFEKNLSILNIKNCDVNVKSVTTSSSSSSDNFSSTKLFSKLVFLLIYALRSFFMFSAMNFFSFKTDCFELVFVERH